jgi:hypothetical protein
MKVIGAGFARTGTTSTKRALEALGFGPVHHMSEIKSRPETVHDWLRVASGDRPDWDRMLAGYQANLDWPSAVYWRELAEHYPDAKVLLTVRDPEQWHDSMEKTIFSNVGRTRGLMWHLLPLLNSLRSRERGAFIRMTRKTIFEGVFGGDITDRHRNISIFEQHIAAVTAAIAADRLLVFDVKDGWHPLCAFLGVPVPDRPIPYLNDRDSYAENGREYRQRALRSRAG